ncbi:mannose-1-phosphate guanylyltransferase [Carboxylicivirga caseinilyticus]|uniref:mannose-1-phosphate guanylyltransferase n=1 Tax=Carboxylicivirga caseinilyticus TaxID=3417572 RepID=UPI003D338C08|nr:mannose-1-phosphate guanylyltransferase [Marinilabiliaceae bacterium A049]
MKQNTYCVIMAGGVGSRFWPLSTSQTPKQFLDIFGTGKSLLQQTFERFESICPLENFIVVTSSSYKHLVMQQLPKLSSEQVLEEPLRRNTAPCIAFANTIIKSKNADANIVVTPADHLILNQNSFESSINKGLEFVESKDALLTLGIKPTHPETGYGYIQIGETAAEEKTFNKVKTFTEKPDIEMATVLFESGEFYWNSGIFMWSLKTIEKAYNTNLSEVATPFIEFSKHIGSKEEEKALHEAYLECKNISIDYGVMEKANNVFVKKVNFGWSDLGTWSSLHEHMRTNDNNNAVIKGDVLLYNTQNTIVHLPEGKKGVIQGLDGYIVVQSDKAILICPRSNEKQIRQFTTDLKTEFGDK